MKRIPKYKFWHKADKKMYDVIRIELDDNHGSTWVEVIRDGDYSCHIDEGELLECTHLKDKNGKEIYEGDIVKFINHNNGKELLREVNWNNEDLCFQFGTSSGWKFQSYLEATNGTMEVIGNIYENPELLEMGI